MLALGFLPVYLEMWKRRGRVVGFSEYSHFPVNNLEHLAYYFPADWVFLSIDTLGALFSLFALGMLLHDSDSSVGLKLTSYKAAQGTFDILGAVLYIVV
jgi:hypothetical protein